VIEPATHFRENEAGGRVEIRHLERIKTAIHQAEENNYRSLEAKFFNDANLILFGILKALNTAKFQGYAIRNN